MKIMDKGYPWFNPSFLYKKCPKPSMSCTARVAQWWYQSKVRCMPLGHLYHTDHIIFVRFPSLNMFHASMRRKPQSSSWEFCCYRRSITCMPTSILASIPPDSLSVPHASLASWTEAFRLHLSTNLYQVSPITTGRTPGCLYRLLRRPDINKW